MQERGCDIWRSVVIRYIATQKPLKTASKKEFKTSNEIEMYFIMEGVPNLVKTKVGQCASTKEIWDNLKYLYARQGLK